MLPSEENYSAWLHSPVGEQFHQQQQVKISELLANMAGFRAMELAINQHSCLLSPAPQLHKFCLQASPESGVGAVCDFDSLPLPSDVVDVALLNHVLDYCEWPHESLKEAARVVQPSGYVLIVGFNPLSAWGILRWIMRWLTPATQWQGRGLSVLRMTDWLKLLGFHCEKVVYGSYNLPIQSHRYLLKTQFIDKWATKLRLPTGGFYIIVAQKRRLRPISTSRKEWLAKAIKSPTLRPENVGSEQLKPNTLHPVKLAEKL